MRVACCCRGPTGIAFATFAEAASMMPLPQLWSILFFCMVACLGLGTQYVLVESGVTALIDDNQEVRVVAPNNNNKKINTEFCHNAKRGHCSILQSFNTNKCS